MDVGQTELTVARTRSADRKRRMLIMGGSSDPSAASHGVEPHPPDPAVSELVSFARWTTPSQALQVVVRRADGARIACCSLDRPWLIAGSGDVCQIRLDHPDVSFRHLYLQWLQGRLLGFDLDSRTGTKWNGAARPTGWLDAGTQLQIGPYTLDVVDDPNRITAHPAAEADPRAGQRLPTVELVITRRRSNKPPLRHTVQHRVTLFGWSPLCQVVLKDQSVSRMHASLVQTPGGVWVIDLFGRGGVKVVGERTGLCRLDDGSEFQIGNYTIGLHIDEPPVDAAPPALAADPGAAVPALEPVVIKTPPPAASAVDENESVPAADGSSVRLGDVARPADDPPSPPEAPPAVPPDAGAGESSVLPEAEAPAEPAYEGTESPKAAATCEEAAPPLPSATAEPAAADDLGAIEAGLMRLPQVPSLQLPEASGTGETAVIALVQHVAAMQQQMFLQSQQSVMMMAKMFASMQKQQMESMREEFAAIHEITRQLQELQLELLRARNGPVEVRAADAEQQGTVSASAHETSPVNGHAVEGHLESDSAAAASSHAHDDAIDADAPAHPPLRERHTPEAEIARSNAVETHAWLTERINSLERERTSRWQKILRAFTGGDF